MNKTPALPVKPSFFCWCHLQSHLFLVTLLVVLGLFVRLYKISTPLADWHSWRQADTASVTREYVKHRYAFLEPHYQDLSDIPSGIENVAGYRMVELPILNFGAAQLLLWQPSWNLVVVSRLVSVFFSLLSIAALYAIVTQLTGKRMLTFLCALVLALLPYSVYYSRVILPEPVMVSFQLISLATFIYWLQLIKKRGTIIQRVFFGSVTIVSLAVALLLKPMAIFIAPVFLIVAFSVLGWKTLRKFELYFFPVLSVLPLLWWRHWILQFPSGIPASDWLYNGNGIRLRPSWWRWLFYDRLTRLMMGYIGAIFLIAGILWKEGKQKFSLFDWVTIVWGASMFGYLVVFATGNVQHDYYQIMLTPIVAIVFGRGVMAIWQFFRGKNQTALGGFLLLFLLISTAFLSWKEVSGYYNINHPEIVAAGQATDTLVPANAKVIAPYDGDTAFLFQTNRTGWPIGGRIDQKIKEGASYYVTTTENDEAKTLEKKYPIVQKNAQYLILKLQ